MKKLFLFSLITLLSMAWQSGYSYDFSASYNGRTLYYNLIYNNNTATAVELTYDNYAYDDYEGLYSGNVVIPSTVTYNGQTLPVTRIGYGAFYQCDGLTSVTIPSSVTSIGNYAFYQCYGLTSVTINSDAIMSKTYTSSSSLKNLFGDQVRFVIIGEGVTSIGAYAFSGCTGLTSVTIPSSVTSIGNYSFNGCYGLTSVTIPSSVTSIGNYSFNGCTGLKSVTIPSSVTSIGYFAFDECNGLTSVIFEGQVNSIGSFALLPTSCIIYVPTGKKAYYQNILGTYYNICERVLYNDIYYVLDKDNHTALICGVYDNTLDEFWLTEQFRLGGVNYTVTDILPNAFQGCRNIKEIYIPETIKQIGANAFYGCSGLKSVTIPSSVTSIGNSAFYNCNNITTVKVPVTDMAAFCNNQVIGQIKSSLNKPVMLIDGEGNEIAEYVIPDGVETISENAFANCKGLTSVTIPSSVTSIGNYAFYYCSGLTSVTILEGVTSIGYEAFYNCTGLTSVTIPSSVTSIGFSAFSRCSGLTSVTIPSSVTSIGNSAFSRCSGLTSVTILEGVTSIGEDAFYWCTGLTSVTIPQSLTSIATDAFADCTSLKTVKVTVTDMATFCNNQVIGQIKSSLNKPVMLIDGEGNKITDYVIPDGVEAIGANAFNNCTCLTSVTIPSSVTSIGSSAFSRCSGLTTVKVPATDMAAFCNNQVIGQIKSSINKPVILTDGEGNEITEYNIPEGVETIGAKAFANCTGLTSINIPAGVTSIGEEAFFGCSGLASITELTIPESVTNIGYAAFASCTSLATVKVPVTDMAAFCNNQVIGQIRFSINKPVVLIDNEGNEITEYNIPVGVQTIGDEAFVNCPNLTSVTIPQSVTSIGYFAFDECNGLTSIKIDAAQCTISDNTFSQTTYNSAILHIPAGRSAWYHEATGWKNFRDIREYDRIFAADINTVNGLRLPLSIQMDNTESAAGFQFVLNLPEDVTVVENNGSQMITLSERSKGLELMVTKLSNQRYLIAALSMGFEEIEGNEGAIVDVTLSIPRVVRAGEYAITLKDITISTADGHSLTPSDYTVTMTVDENTFGDVNNDGVVNVTDALAIVNHVLNKPVRIFVEANADINQDGNINFTDALNLMRLILSSSANGASPALFDTEEQQAPVIPETQELEPM